MSSNYDSHDDGFLGGNVGFGDEGEDGQHDGDAPLEPVLHENEAVLTPGHNDEDHRPKKKNWMPLVIFAVFFLVLIGFVGYKLFGLVSGRSAQPQSLARGVQFPMNGNEGGNPAEHGNSGLMPGVGISHGQGPAQSLLGSQGASPQIHVASAAAAPSGSNPAMMAGGLAPTPTPASTPALFTPPASTPAQSPAQSLTPTNGSTASNKSAPAPMPGVSVVAPTPSVTDAAAAVADVNAKIANLQRKVNDLQSEVDRLANDHRTAWRHTSWHHPSKRLEKHGVKPKGVLNDAAAGATDARHMIFQGYRVRAVYPLSGDKAQAWVESNTGKLSVVSKGSIIGGATVLSVDPTSIEVMTSKGLIIPSGMR